MVAFIDDHRAEYGVEPICRVLPIAPSTYYTHKSWGADPSLRSARAQRDAWLKPEIQRVFDALSANVRETRSTQRIRVGRRQRNGPCWDCERE